ncbi:unnamed protein product [Closterium sp. NIES-54]
MATMKLTVGADVAEQQLGNEEAFLILPHGYDPDGEDEPAYCFHGPAPEEPASMEEALVGQDREKWLVFRDAEYQSLLENGTWDLVVLPEGKKAVQPKWVLRIKTDDNGQVAIYKSRLVAKGFMQKEKKDFNEIFAPTAKSPTLHVLLTDVAVSRKFIIQMDISTAFLNGILEEDVYMPQPPGYEDGTGRVCKLKKPIYGLKQAPRCWYQKLAAVLEEIGFRTSSCDESLFLKGGGGGEAGAVSGLRGRHSSLQQQHEGHPESAATADEELEVQNPWGAEFKLVKAAEDEGVEAEEQLQFQSLVCSLLYAAVHTRPDISFLVGQLARVVQNPSEEQVHAAERVVKSLNSHPSIGVQYSASAQVKQKGVEVLKEKGEWLGEGKLFLTCFTDAMWASLKDDSSSVGGYICVVGVGPDGWRPKKQTETALSSVESEHMAMFYRVEEVIWLRRLLEEIGQEQKVATPLFCDNKGALGMARNAVLHGLNKHMRIKWHWLRKEPESKVFQQMEQITMQLDLTPSVWEEGEEAAAEGGDGEKVQEAPAGGGDDVETSGSTKEAAGSEGGELQQRKTKVPALPSRRKQKGVVVRGWETPVSRPGRTRMATMKLTAGADVAEQQLGNEEALLILPHGYHPDEEYEPAYCFLAPAPEEPASMEEALAGPDREKWLVSRDAEYQSLFENGTWDLVVLPEGKKAVQRKWMLRIKTDDKGQVTIYKSRLVAKRFMQMEKQDFNEIFAPTAKPPTLRVLLADVAVSGKFIIQMDISTAFFNGIFEEEAYMTQPPGYKDGTGRVCNLKKSIYGLKQVPRCRYQKLAAVLEEIGFRISSCDESLFLKGEGEKLVLFVVYVDDILLFSRSMKDIQNVQ